MKRVALGLILLFCAPQAHAQQRPPEAAFAPLDAVDHVAEYEVEGAALGAGRSVIKRHGDWLREERSRGEINSTIYSNVRTGVSISTVRDDRSVPTNVRASRRNSLRAEPELRAGERGNHLGRRCDVWSTPLTGERGPAWLHCRTRNGIELWSRVLYSSGEQMSSSQAVRIERRRVLEEEVLPPANILDWSSWQEWYPPPDASGPNDEVILAGEGPDGPATLVIRRRGAARYSHQRSVRFEQLISSTGAITFVRSTDHRGDDVSIARSHPEENLAFGEPRPLGRSEIVLGRVCSWMDMMPGFGDAGWNDCQTEDGLVLARVQSGRGRMTRFTATEINIGGVTPEEMTPPVEALTWPLRSSPTE